MSFYSEDCPACDDADKTLYVNPVKNHSSACSICFYVQRGSFSGVKQGELVAAMKVGLRVFGSRIGVFGSRGVFSSRVGVFGSNGVFGSQVGFWFPRGGVFGARLGFFSARGCFQFL